MYLIQLNTPRFKILDNTLDINLLFLINENYQKG